MSETTPKTRQQKPAEAVHGSVKVLQAIGTIGPASHKVGEIAINEKPCLIRVTETGYQLFGFDVKKGEPTHYDLSADLSGCDCPDHTFHPERPGGCKHMVALKALVRGGKLPAVQVSSPAHSDAEADALADQWADDMGAADAEAEAWHSQYDAA